MARCWSKAAVSWPQQPDSSRILAFDPNSASTTTPATATTPTIPELTKATMGKENKHRPQDLSAMCIMAHGSWKRASDRGPSFLFPRWAFGCSRGARGKMKGPWTQNFESESFSLRKYVSEYIHGAKRTMPTTLPLRFLRPWRHCWLA